MTAYVGIDSVARKMKAAYVGVDGVARKVKKAYVGVDGVARLWWEEAPELAPASAIAVGSYIDYTANGYGSWRVLFNNSGQLDIISAGSVGTYTLSGKDGYYNAVSLLNGHAANWGGGTYATAARCMGCTSESTASFSGGHFAMTGSPYEDSLYETDVNQIVANGLTQTDAECWLASRRIEGYNNGWLDYGTKAQVRTLLTSGSLDYWTLFWFAFSTSYEDSADRTFGFRPVISLQSGLYIASGDGSAGSPYALTTL